MYPIFDPRQLVFTDDYRPQQRHPGYSPWAQATDSYNTNDDFDELDREIRVWMIAFVVF